MGIFELAGELVLTFILFMAFVIGAVEGSQWWERRRAWRSVRRSWGTASGLPSDWIGMGHRDDIAIFDDSFYDQDRDQ